MPANTTVTDPNTMFLYLCLTNSDYSKIDFEAIGGILGLKATAVRMRWSRLKKAIESNAVDGKPAPALGGDRLSGAAAKTGDTTEDDGIAGSSDAHVTFTPSPSKKRKVAKAKANPNANAKANENGETEAKTTMKKGSAKGKANAKGKGKGIVKKMEEMDVDTAVEEDAENENDGGHALVKHEELAFF
ncbi:hypothetical protein BJX99DRAFT_256269 [Aspergillus californicus]